MELSYADLVWNRACEGGGANPAPGDQALASLLSAHGLAMNGGIMHAVEVLDQTTMAAAMAGYKFFSFDAIPGLLLRAKDMFDTDFDLGIYERQFDREYAEYIPDDQTIVDRFKHHLRNNPADFSPL